ncbi:hypothetical protein J2S19_002344 [Metabacillus malikii]|uniref:Uncharacterized protein n=1 Tax=Metabacillus malikii TaxID=1504265 RepID=A0ABT9ZFP1_9BACI|nr:hypothetical protein [Metabacillus malikii]
MKTKMKELRVGNGLHKGMKTKTRELKIGNGLHKGCEDQNERKKERKWSS